MDYHYTLGFFGWGIELPLWSLPLLILVVFWTYLWKGPALWHAAQHGKFWWFIAFLILNTVGILELFYLFFVAKIKPKNFLKFKKKS